MIVRYPKTDASRRQHKLLSMLLLYTLVGVFLSDELSAQDDAGAVIQPLELKRPAPDPFGQNIHGRFTRNELEELLYGTLGGSRQAFRRARRDTVQRNVDRMDQVCKLTATQQEKVQQAIDIDIARTEAKIASLLSEIQDKTTPARKQEVFNQAWQSIHIIQQQQKTVTDSLWHKVLMSSLSDEQKEKLKQDEERIQSRNRDVARHRLVLLLQRRVGLTSSQRNAIHTHLQNASGLQPSSTNNAPILTFEDLVLHLERLPVDQRRSLLTDSQWDKARAKLDKVPAFPGENLVVP